MIALSEAGFHEAMAAHPQVACILHRGPHDHGEAGAMAGAMAGDADDARAWTWASLDLAAAPGIEAMFGLAGKGDHLLVMRDRVVLFCDALPASHEALRAILDRAAALDMAKVQAELAEERANRAAIAGRRVCPTAWRTR